MNLSAIYSKTGKGVQEASGKTSFLSRADRAVLAAIDGRTSVADIQPKFDKIAGPKFEALIDQLEKDGFIRVVSHAEQAPTSARRRCTRSGQPALTVPLGMSSDGLPIGVQLVARHAEEAALLTLGTQLETALPFAMDPVVYDFAINEHGSVAQLLERDAALLPLDFYRHAVPGWLRREALDKLAAEVADMDAGEATAAANVVLVYE